MEAKIDEFITNSFTEQPQMVEWITDMKDKVLAELKTHFAEKCIRNHYAKTTIKILFDRSLACH